MYFKHGEFHRIERIGWLRAAVLGANDGIISTASLLIGIAAAHTTHSAILVAGVAALIAGAMSVAAKIGGSKIIKGAARVALWGTLAMLLTAYIGSLLGAAIL